MFTVVSVFHKQTSYLLPLYLLGSVRRGITVQVQIKIQGEIAGGKIKKSDSSKQKGKVVC